jgi:hypothetical protein
VFLFIGLGLVLIKLHNSSYQVWGEIDRSIGLFFFFLLFFTSLQSTYMSMGSLACSYPLVVFTSRGWLKITLHLLFVRLHRLRADFVINPGGRAGGRVNTISAIRTYAGE